MPEIDNKIIAIRRSDRNKNKSIDAYEFSFHVWVIF